MMQLPTVTSQGAERRLKTQRDAHSGRSIESGGGDRAYRCVLGPWVRLPSRVYRCVLGPWVRLPSSRAYRSFETATTMAMSTLLRLSSTMQLPTATTHGV